MATARVTNHSRHRLPTKSVVAKAKESASAFTNSAFVVLSPALIGSPHPSQPHTIKLSVGDVTEESAGRSDLGMELGFGKSAPRRARPSGSLIRAPAAGSP